MSVGNQMAFGDYARSRAGMLLRSALALTGGNRADAEDLVQATLINAYRSWDRISDLAAVDTYVRRVMVNTHISSWRRRKVDEYPTDEIPDQAAADPSDERDLQDVVQRALDRLPRQMRAAVMLRFYNDMTEPQVAAALGITVGTVKSTVARAVAKLREDEALRADTLSCDRRPHRNVRPGSEAETGSNTGLPMGILRGIITVKGTSGTAFVPRGLVRPTVEDH